MAVVGDHGGVKPKRQISILSCIVLLQALYSPLEARARCLPCCLTHTRMIGMGLTVAYNPILSRCCYSLGKPTLRSRPVVFCLGSGSSDVDCDDPDPHAVLGIHPSATKEQIRASFRQQAKTLHPDVSDLSEMESAERFKALVTAYDEAIRLTTVPKPPQLNFPDGLAAVERARWLINANKIMLFMRGTKQMPSDQDSRYAVSLLSIAAFDTRQRFAAYDVEIDLDVANAVMHQSSLPSLPICYIDGQLIGGPGKIEALHESGQLRRMFGGIDDETPPCPEELLEWRCGGWQEPENWAEICKGMRLERNPCSAKLQWVKATNMSSEMLPGSAVEKSGSQHARDIHI